MSQEIIWLLTALILPPGGLILLGLYGVKQDNRIVGKLIIIMTFAMLYLLSTSYVSRKLTTGLEVIPALTPAQIQATNAEAIVLLGGGTYLASPEYGGDTVTPFALERIRYAAKLARDTGLPVIPTGGKTHNEGAGEASLTREILQKEFAVAVATSEENSLTNRENAAMTKVLLDDLKLKRVFLVTHGWHMLRAVDSFTRAGIEVVPAPMGFNQTPANSALKLRSWLPDAEALMRSNRALHEYLGLLWYRLREQVADLI